MQVKTAHISIMLIEELLKELKEYRNELVSKNYPFQRISNLILKYDDKLNLDIQHHRDTDPIDEDDDCARDFCTYPSKWRNVAKHEQMCN